MIYHCIPQVGGAIATALGLAGVGYGLMKHHEKSVEEVGIFLPSPLC